MRRLVVVLSLALGCSAEDGSVVSSSTTGDDASTTDPGSTGTPGSTTTATGDASTGTPPSDTTSSTETGGSTTTGPDVDPVEPWPALRGALHVHSPFSHDACDGDGLPGGSPNQPCLSDLRAAICATGFDFTLLTDHPSFMRDFPFPDLLLSREGDAFEMGAEGPIANRIDCGDGHEAMVAVGYESTHTLPLGLHHHVDPQFYAGLTDAVPSEDATALVAALQDAGAVVSIAHSEEGDLSAARIVESGVDSMEWYNPHGNFLTVLGGDQLGGDPATILDLLGGLTPFMVGSDSGAHPDLVYLRLLPQWPEEGFAKWREVLRARHVTGVFGSDVHQNVSISPMCDQADPLLQAACVAAAEAILPASLAGLISGGTVTMADGDRLDSYDRIFRWLENRVLVDPDQPVGLTTLQDSLRQGRSYGLFSVFGDPTDFAFLAQTDNDAFQIGERLAPPFGLTVRVPTMPSPMAAAGPQWTDEQAQAATVRTLLVHTDAAGSETLQQVEGLGAVLEQDVTAEGAYHVEIWIRPGHLTEALGSESELAQTEYLWLITNPIHARAGD